MCKSIAGSGLETDYVELATIFSIDIAAYAIMSNHYHVVLHIDKEQAANWSAPEVCEHWRQLFSGNDLSNRFLSGEALTPTEKTQLDVFIEQWRNRLIDISWFMRCLNEPIARKANKEDKASGRFYKYPPWYLPFGPAELFKIFPEYFVGRVASNLRHYSMKKPWLPVWLMWI